MSITPLITAEQLSQGRRLLYMSHLAIGDYMYQGVFLQALKQQYPNLEIDIWIDDCRKKPKSWHAGRNDTLCQWLERDPAIDHIYPIAANKAERAENIQRAQQQDYDLVFFFATQRSEQFARYARLAAPKAYITGTKVKPWSNPVCKWWYFRQLDGFFSIDNNQVAKLDHISDAYAQHFKQLIELGPVTYTPSRTQVLNIPAELQQQANQQLQQLAQQHQIDTPYFVFINHLSTTEKRDYSWSQVEELLVKLTQKNKACVFVLNLPPGELKSYQAKLKQSSQLATLPIIPFSAIDDFYQLPAMINSCHKVITVETAIMHIAASLGKPQIVLVRDSAKQWYPLNTEKVLSAGNRVDNIKVDDVVSAFE